MHALDNSSDPEPLVVDWLSVKGLSGALCGTPPIVWVVTPDTTERQPRRLVQILSRGIYFSRTQALSDEIFALYVAWGGDI